MQLFRFMIARAPHRAGAWAALKLGHPVEAVDDPAYEVHLAEWDCYTRLGAVMSAVPDIQQFGIAEGAAL